MAPFSAGSSAYICDSTRGSILVLSLIAPRAKSKSCLSPSIVMHGAAALSMFFVLRANSKAWLPQNEVVHVATARSFSCGLYPRLGCPRTLLFKHRHSLRWRAVECPCSAHSLHALLRNSIGTRRQQQPPDPIQDLA